MKNFAEFYKCALQVNPYSYVVYRGKDHEMDEDKYNKEILRHCVAQDIKVVGLADHGNIQTSEKLRNFLTDNGVTVFPGFEIATAEKIHIVCLFPENTTPEQLNRYLGRLGLTDVENGVLPSNISCLDIAKIIEEELNGFWYAAHITSDNGILKMGQMNLIWKDEKLRAAQIPHSITEVDPRFSNIIKNKEPMYKKDTPFAFINAKDICKPEDLQEKNSYCLVKMSEVNFICFKQAFKDPAARVKLSYELNERYQSSIDKVEVFGGYLDELSINFSKNLNTTIGGRGTGKSTLIELIRYALDLEPKSDDSRKYFKELIKQNLGFENGRIELEVTSYQRYGQKYRVIKRYEEPLVIENTDGTVSNLSVNDILPHIEIYGQNEIIEIVSNEEAKLNVLNRFLPNQEQRVGEREKIIDNLKRNAIRLIDVKGKIEEVSEKIGELPKLEEKINFFKDAGVADKLEEIEYFSTEDEFIKKTIKTITEHSIEFSEAKPPFDDNFIKETLNEQTFISMKEIVDEFNLELNKIKDQYERLEKDTAQKIEDVQTNWKELKRKSDKDVEEKIKSLDGFSGKSGAEIAFEYKQTISEIAKIKPVKNDTKRLEDSLNEIKDERRNLLERLKKNHDNSFDELRKAIKKINKGKLKGKVHIDIYSGKNREDLISSLSNVEGLGEKSLSWINDIEEFSLSSFVEYLEQGSQKLIEEYKITKSKAEILSALPLEKRLELELVQLLDVIDVKLNTGSKDRENYKSLSKLSKGQQCTAILNILMLDNKDPLIIDQPEDNLDNSYIANNLVDGLREYKINRQFIFATHNANIPVFGDAELIGVMQEVDSQGSIKENCIGSVDNSHVKSAVINTLEGGGTAFQMRRAKYNL
ncbi:TrlF family AAA-like ATPase [Salinicoccus roseus]|uniref:TrlF family AAA-like ATPase n=1 Tax=Salinicoccus roseus TaxID=45670 RepID=UPI00211AEEA3|nr:hypothetical protein [Salinicoccus roseus]